MARKTSFGRDRGLQTRMLLTLFLLGLVYAVLIAVLIAAGAGAVTVAVIAARAVPGPVLHLGQDRAVLDGRARGHARRRRRELHADRSSGCASRPTCRSRASRSPRRSMPNAFAVGRSPKTRDRLRDHRDPGSARRRPSSRRCSAHELTHVQNRDVMVMTIASFFASIAAFIVQMGFWFGGAFGDDEDSGPAVIVVILVSAVVYVVSFLLLQALSRYREFAADRGSAIITGRPSALISALLKISGTMEQIPQRDLRAASGELAAFYIFPPKAKQTVASLFSTHPPLEERIAALQRLEAQLQGTALGPEPRDRISCMGFLDVLTGKRKLAGPGAGPAVRDEHRVRDARDLARDRPRAAAAAIVFQPLATADFESIVTRHGGGRARHRRPTAARPSRAPTTATASAGWCSAAGTSTTSSSGSTPSRARSRPAATASGCCAPCSRSRIPRSGRVYWIYNYKRGAFYPFVPARGDQQRDNERELVLKAQIGAELPVEPELERWFPLWGIPI